MRAPHVVLGIPVGSPERDIRRAYRRLAKQLHPDRAAPADRAAAHARFIELRAAYEAMLAQAAVVEVGAEEGSARPREAAGGFRPAGAQSGADSEEAGPRGRRSIRVASWLRRAVWVLAGSALLGAALAIGAVWGRDDGRGPNTPGDPIGVVRHWWTEIGWPSLERGMELLGLGED